MRRHHLALLAALAAGGPLAGAACRGATEPRSGRLELEGVDVPDAVPAGSRFSATVRYGFGACERVLGARTRTSEGRIEIEMRGESTVGGDAVCPDILYIGSTVVSVTAPASGEILVVGLQPSGSPIERRVQVVSP